MYIHTIYIYSLAFTVDKIYIVPAQLQKIMHMYEVKTINYLYTLQV